MTVFDCNSWAHLLNLTLCSDVFTRADDDEAAIISMPDRECRKPIEEDDDILVKRSESLSLLQLIVRPDNVSPFKKHKSSKYHRL